METVTLSPPEEARMGRRLGMSFRECGPTLAQLADATGYRNESGPQRITSGQSKVLTRVAKMLRGLGIHPDTNPGPVLAALKMETKVVRTHGDDTARGRVQSLVCQETRAQGSCDNLEVALDPDDIDMLRDLLTAVVRHAGRLEELGAAIIERMEELEGERVRGNGRGS